MPDLMCIGLTTLDILAKPVDVLPKLEETVLVDDISLSPAGTAAGTAVLAAKLGLSSALISAVGDDVNGGLVQSLLSDANVDTQHMTTVSGMRTSTTVLAIASDGQRPNYHMMGASLLSQFTPESLEAAKSAKVFHFAGVGFPHLSAEDTVKALAELQGAGVIVSCDLIAPQPNTLDVLTALLPHIDIFMPSRAEVLVMLGEIEMEQALQKFCDLGAKHCMIKLGADGAIGLIDGEVVNFPARKIEPVDTTSCGDSFCAGVIYGLVNDMSLNDAAQFGIATASLVAQGMGTTGALTSAQDVLAVLGQP